MNISWLFMQSIHEDKSMIINELQSTLMYFLHSNEYLIHIVGISMWKLTHAFTIF